ncbi:MAG: cyclic nucleotide-binding domain-containing protein, partial [Actinomycetes bacterium]
MTIAEGTQRLPVQELRKLFLFEKLSDEQLQWLTQHGWVAEAPSGATFLAEGDPAELFIVLLSGTITMSRRVGQDDVETVRTDQVGVYAGAMQAYLADPAGQTYVASIRVVSDARFFVLRAEDFAWMARTWFPMAIHLLEGL